MKFEDFPQNPSFSEPTIGLSRIGLAPSILGEVPFFSVAVKVDYNIFWLVVEKYESQWEGLSHILWIIYIYISGWWFGTFGIFPSVGNVIIPTDFHIFQRG